MAGFPVTLLDTLETTLQKGWKGVRDRRVNGEVYDWTLDGAPCELNAWLVSDNRVACGYGFCVASAVGVYILHVVESGLAACGHPDPVWT